MLTREELKANNDNVMKIMENRVMQMTGCDRTTANLVANEILELDRVSESLLNLEDVSDIEMTRAEMIAYIRSNPWVKISHHSFASDEYIFSKDDGRVYDENGRLFEDWNQLHDGIRRRIGTFFQTGWTFYKE